MALVVQRHVGDVPRPGSSKLYHHIERVATEFVSHTMTTRDAVPQGTAVVAPVSDAAVSDVVVRDAGAGVAASHALVHVGSASVFLRGLQTAALRDA